MYWRTAGLEMKPKKTERRNTRNLPKIPCNVTAYQVTTVSQRERQMMGLWLVAYLLGLRRLGAHRHYDAVDENNGHDRQAEKRELHRQGINTTNTQFHIRFDGRFTRRAELASSPLIFIQLFWKGTAGDQWRGSFTSSKSFLSSSHQRQNTDENDVLECNIFLFKTLLKLQFWRDVNS